MATHGALPPLVRRWRGGATYPALFVVAFGVRLLVAQVSGGLSRVYLSYDAGVYYAAADAFTFGRLPYRDFVLLHPPGLMLVLTPFAGLGRIAGDRVGFMVAVVAFMLLGSAGAVLTAVVCSRMGMPRVAAALGGLCYAVWLGSAQAEYQIRLEPLGNVLLLLGLLAYLSSRGPGGRRAALLAGVAFGAAASVKIWWAVPVVVLVGWHLARGHRRNLGAVVCGAAAAMVVIDLPFAIASHWTMWTMVVEDQLTRPESGLSAGGKLLRLFGIEHLLAGAPPGATAPAVIAAVVLAALVAASAWRLRAARLVVVLLVAQVVVLLAAPSWFVYYPDYLAPTAAVAVAAGFVAHRVAAPLRAAHRGGERARLVAAARPMRWASVLALAGILAVTTRFLVTGTGAAPVRPSTELTAAVTRVPCLMSDSPSGLILLDALSRSLRNGCPNWIDVAGREYGMQVTAGPRRVPVPRTDNPAWQRAVLAYLTSGDAVLLLRPRGTGLDAASLAVLRSGPVLARSGDDVVYLTPRRTAGRAGP